jgi:AcrR family transcriptional regulator
MARLNSARRERVIVSAALRLANEHGLAYLTAERVAAACRVKTSEATVRRYFHTVDQLRLRVAGDPGAGQKLFHEARDMGLI